MTMQEQVELYKEDLSLFDDKDSKLEYILGYSNEATPLDPSEKTDENIVKGCASLAWLSKGCKDGKVILRGEADSIIGKGMMVVLLSIFNNRTPDEILSFDPKLIQKMGVTELLSPVRLQGMEAFLNLIYNFAKSCKENEK